jgi:hypothetical protein
MIDSKAERRRQPGEHSNVANGQWKVRTRGGRSCRSRENCPPFIERGIIRMQILTIIH